jgi:hypothetical protein
VYTFLYIFQNFKQILAKKLHITLCCLRRFASPDKGFAQQRPGLAKCGGVLAWE